MKTKSSLESAFFNPRALIGFGFGAIGLLLGLVAFIALPTPSAFAPPEQCSDVEYTEQSGPIQGAVYVAMSSTSSGVACTIYFTVGFGPPATPTHSSAVYTNPYVVFYGQKRYFKAFGHKLYAIPEDSAVSAYEADNTGN